MWGATEQDTRGEGERELWVGNYFNRRKFRVFKGLSIDTIQFVIKKGLGGEPQWCVGESLFEIFLFTFFRTLNS